MVNVSKNPVDDATLSSIHRMLVKHIAKMNGGRRGERLLRELLSPAERLQFAKRFAIVLLLSDGVGTAEIEKKLKVSRTTVGAIEEKIEQGAFTETLAMCKGMRRGSEWALIEKALRAGLPPRGRGRWRIVHGDA